MIHERHPGERARLAHTLRGPEPAFIEVFPDGHCAMCRSFADWLERQPRAFPVRMLPYQSAAARSALPGIDSLEPGQLMIVRDDHGRIHRGAEAWVMCLWSCTNHRRLARRLASPALLPLARRACLLLAANRRRISRLLFRGGERELRRELETACPDGSCHLPDAPGPSPQPPAAPDQPDTT